MAIPKKNKIPFILFVSTEPVGKNGYMTWEQIKEVEKEKFVYWQSFTFARIYDRFYFREI